MKSKVSVYDFYTDRFKDVSSNELEFRVSVYGILIEKGKLLIHFFPGIKKYNLPGGRIEKGEAIKEALIREFREETGLKIRPIKLEKVKEGFIAFDKSYYQSVLLFYRVKRVSGLLGDIKDKKESSEAKFVPIDDSLEAKMQLIFKGVIKKGSYSNRLP